MTISLLELRRARRVLDDFCARRNAASTGQAGRLHCRQKGDRLFIGEIGPMETAYDSGHFRALVQLSYQSGQWCLSWSQGKGDWRPYPHLPEAGSIQAVVDELEQAPLHVYWG